MLKHIKNIYNIKLLTITLAIVFLFLFQHRQAMAEMKSPPPEKIKAIVIRDRVKDIGLYEMYCFKNGKSILPVEAPGRTCDLCSLT